MPNFRFFGELSRKCQLLKARPELMEQPYTNASLNVSVKRFLKSDIPDPIITHVNQTFNFTTVNYPDNIQVSLIHEEHEIGHRGYLIEFEMIPSKAAHWIFTLYYFYLFCYVTINFETEIF
uniref:Uncharacterized protein n=1 Tax=Panagrolaimus davidi TaxID=227884 RepID=A0A914QWA8_9BILA